MSNNDNEVFCTKSISVQTRWSNGGLIGTVDINTIPHNYFKEDNESGLAIGDYRYQVGRMTIPADFYHLMYDLDSKKISGWIPVNREYTNELFIVNIIPKKEDKFVDDDGKSINNLTLLNAGYDFKRFRDNQDNLIDFKDCGRTVNGVKGECRACLKYASGSLNKVFCTIGTSGEPDFFYIPTVGKTINGVSDIIYFKTDNDFLLWAWLKEASDPYAGIAVNGGVPEEARPSDEGIGIISDINRMHPKSKCEPKITTSDFC